MSAHRPRSRRLLPAALRAACGLLPMLACVLAARAEPGTDDAVSQVVEVHSLKNPALMPYRKAYDMIAGVDDVAAHRVRLLIRVTSSESEAPMPDLGIRLVGEHTHAQVPVSSAGVVDLPLDRAAYDDAADIVTNKAMKSLKVTVFVRPRIEPGEVRYADVVDASEAGRAAIARIVPWYLRLLVPAVHGVALCYPAPGQAVAIKGREEAPRAAAQEDRDEVDGHPIFCARFSAKEKGFGRETVLLPDDGWQARFW